MTIVTAQVAGGEKTKVKADTVAEVKEMMGALAHTAKVNGESESDDYILDDDDFVTLAPKVKAG